MASEQVFVEESKLNAMVLAILASTNVVEINEFGKLSCDAFAGKSNFEVSNDKIEELINALKTSNVSQIGSKTFNLSILRVGDVNKVDINVMVKKDTHINFYLCGKDLYKYCRNLPHIIVINGRTGIKDHYPKNGSGFSKWYPFIGNAIRIMVKIATNLRLLELYLRSIKRTHGIAVRKGNVLGLDISFEISRIFTPYAFLHESNFVCCVDNPEKLAIGKFLYKQNGVYSRKINFMLKYTLETFPHMRGLIFPKVIKNFDVNTFYNSSYTFALSGWNRHARLLIKVAPEELTFDELSVELLNLSDIVSETESIVSDDFDNSSESDKPVLQLNSVDNLCDIYVVDPWMKKLPKTIFENLIETNPSISIKFIKRFCTDQGIEGSCVLCCFSRLLQISNSVQSNNSMCDSKSIIKNLDTYIPDFYAYLSSVIFRQC
jgi:hypothetical protein